MIREWINKGMSHLERAGTGEPHCIKSKKKSESFTFILSHLQVKKSQSSKSQRRHECTFKEIAGAAVPCSWNVNIMFKNTNCGLDGLDVCVFVQLCVSILFAVVELTISVSDTGPKLVTKIFVLISVTFSVEREQLRTSEARRGHRKVMKRIGI